MRTTTKVGTIAALVAALTSTAVAAAEPCRPPSGGVDPAFAAPGGCVATDPKASPKRADGWTTTPDGKRRWSGGDTSVTVSGSVRFEAGTGNAVGSPTR